jgi:hypothetical protein
MDTSSWSWIIHSDLGVYPGIRGGSQPRWEDEGRTCVLPVHLKPDTVYAVGVNSIRHSGFRDKDRGKAVPYVWVFRTGPRRMTDKGDARANTRGPALAGFEGAKAPSASLPGAPNPFKREETAPFAAYSEDGKLLATAGLDGSIRIWNAETGANITRLRGDIEGIVSAVFSPDSSKLATIDREGTVHVWDAGRGSSLFRISGDTFGASSIAFSPNAKYLATAGRGNTLYIWNAATGSQHLRILKVSSKKSAIAFSEEGGLLATLGTDGLVSLWEIETGRQRFRFRGMDGEIVSFSFSPDGKSMSIVNDREQMHVWDAKTGAQKFRILDVQRSDDGPVF